MFLSDAHDHVHAHGLAARVFMLVMRGVRACAHGDSARARAHALLVGFMLKVIPLNLTPVLLALMSLLLMLILLLRMLLILALVC